MKLQYIYHINMYRRHAAGYASLQENNQTTNVRKSKVKHFKRQIKNLSHKQYRHRYGILEHLQ